MIKKLNCAGPQLFTPVIQASQTEFKRTTVQSQPRKIVCKTQNPLQKQLGRVSQGVGPEFKPQYNNTNNNT
jgi:hypothetical protein